MKLGLKDKERLYFVSTDEVIACKSEGNYTKIILQEKSITIYISLKLITNLLPITDFYRCHNSYIINLLKVKEYNLKNNTVLLSNKLQIPVSLRHRRNLIKILRSTK